MLIPFKNGYNDITGLYNHTNVKQFKNRGVPYFFHVYVFIQLFRSDHWFLLWPVSFPNGLVTYGLS